MKYWIILYICFVFYSCQNNRDNNEKKQIETKQLEKAFPSVNEEFTGYLDKFKKIGLPIVIKGCNIISDGYKQFDGKKFGKYSEAYSLAYGQIPTNGNYVATLTLGAADCYLPILTTYKLNGQIIDKKTIAIGGCGSDCGFTCEEYMTIRKNYTFYTSDTISTYTCDSLGNETPGSYQYYVVYVQGKLLPDGKIEISPEIKKELTGRKNEP